MAVPSTPSPLLQLAPDAPSAPLPAASIAVAAEHRELRARLDRLIVTTDLPAIIGELLALREMLARHFAAEEAEEGLRTSFERAVPHLLPELDRVLGEHAALLAEVEACCTAAIRCWRGPAAELFAAVGSIADRLADHEERENALFGDVIYLDIGAGQ